MADKTPQIKIGDTTYIKQDDTWVDKKSKAPAPPGMQNVLEQGLAKSQKETVPVEDKSLKVDLLALQNSVEKGDSKEQESLLALIDRVKELNKTMGGVESEVSTLGDKLQRGPGAGPNESPMSPQDQIKSIKLSIGELLKAAIKGAIGEGSRSGGKFMETYNQLRAVPQIEKDPATGKYINKLTGKEHGESDYKEEQEKYNNRPGRLVAAGSSAMAGIGKYFQGVGERLDPTGIVRRFNDLNQNNKDQIKANEYEQKRLAGLPGSGSDAPDAKPALNTGDHISAQSGVKITDISQNVITKLADAITKAIKGETPPPITPEEIAQDSRPMAANDNKQDATKVPEGDPNGTGAGLLLGLEALWSTFKSKLGDIFEGIAKFGKKMAASAGEFIGAIADKAKKIVGDLLEGAGKLLEGAKKSIGGIAEEGGKLVKGGMKAVGGLAEGAGKALGTGGKVVAKGAGRLGGALIPGVGAGIDAYSSAEAYKKGNNLAGGLYAAGGALNATGAAADLTGIGAPIGIAADIAGFGLTGAGMAAEFFGDPFAKKKPANVPLKPSVVPKTAAVAGMTNKNAAMKDQAASSKFSSPIISSDNSSKTTVINHNSNMSMMLPTAADRGSLKLATYT